MYLYLQKLVTAAVNDLTGQAVNPFPAVNLLTVPVASYKYKKRKKRKK